MDIPRESVVGMMYSKEQNNPILPHHPLEYGL